MTEVMKFAAEAKTLEGKGVSRALRREGKLPAVIYGGGDKGVMVSLSQKEFVNEYQKGGIKTRLVEIIVGGKPITAITKVIQFDPVTDAPIHVDFLRVGKDTVVKVSLAIRILNEDKSPGIKKGGVVNIVHRTVDFYCHPSNIPNHIDIDIANLEIGNNVHINDLKLPQGVSPVDKSNFTLVSVAARAEEVAATTTTETVAPAATTAAPAADDKKKK